MGKYRYRVEYTDVRDEYNPIDVTYIAADNIDELIRQFRFQFSMYHRIIEVARCIDTVDWSVV